MPADAFLILGFGGPETSSEVMPFLRKVTAGRGVPDERLQAVARQYDSVGGASPLNSHTRALVAAVEHRLRDAGDTRPVYYANRNTAPYVADVVAAMAGDGVGKATVFVPSAFPSYSGCRQYLEDLEGAALSAATAAPILRKVAPFARHRGYLNPLLDAARESRRRLGPDAVLLASAHSLPAPMAARCAYEAELHVAMNAISVGAGFARAELAFQSRSGRPEDPWLGPDVGQQVATLAAQGVRAVVVAPIGFVHDHMEVIYDLDQVLVPQAEALGLEVERIVTPGSDPRFVEMVAELLQSDDGLETTAVTACGPGRCASR